MIACQIPDCNMDLPHERQHYVDLIDAGEIAPPIRFPAGSATPEHPSQAFVLTESGPGTPIALKNRNPDVGSFAAPAIYKIEARDVPGCLPAARVQVFLGKRAERADRVARRDGGQTKRFRR
jgi:hypothetical protein